MAFGSQRGGGTKVTEIENEHVTGSKQWKSHYEYSTCNL